MIRVGATTMIVLAIAAPLRAVTITVDDDGPADYNNIPAAIAAAAAGATVEVHAGTYWEHLKLEKSINLIGVDLPSIADPPPPPGPLGRTRTSEYGISVYASTCRIEGFRIGVSFEVRGSGCTIRNNIFDKYGLSLWECSNNVVSNNHISGSGIGLFNSTNNTIRENFISEGYTGIGLSSSPANTLLNNEITGCDEGLVIYNSGQNTLRENSVRGGSVSFTVDAYDTVDYEQDIDTSNTLDGKPIYYLIGKSDVVINAASNAACVVAVDCSRLTVRDLTLNHNFYGVLFVNTRNSRIERVTAGQNERCDICLEHSPDNVLIGNTATDSTFGIYLYYSRNSTLQSNIMVGNLYNFNCHGDSGPDYVQNIDITNKVNGKSIYYFVGKEHVVLDDAVNAACVFAVDCTNITVRDQTLAGNGKGLVLVDCRSPAVENVTAAGNDWAGIMLLSCAQATLSRCSASDNYDGIYLSDCNDARLDRTTLSRNWQGLRATNSDLTLTNCYVHSNIETGGIIFEYDTKATILNCTIYGNAGGWWDPNDGWYVELGGILADHYCNVTMANTIAWSNHPNHPWQIGRPYAFQATCCDIQGGFPGQGNIDEPPMLTADGHLGLGSPCIDKGRTYGDDPPYDMDGERRSEGQSVDIGMDEYIDGDNDGLPDWWELKYFGDKTVANANDDPDGDAHTNVTEYELYSTDPTIPAVTYYVDAARPDDAGDGVSSETAKKTIQAAIDLANGSDRIRIAPGLYNEEISTLGHPILVTSLNANDPNTVARTILTGTLAIQNSEGPGCVVAGLTIVAGYSFGLVCSNSSPTIRNCVFTGSLGWGDGAIQLDNAAPTISHCTIGGNCAGWIGAGIYCQSSTPVIRNCIIAGNVAGEGHGGEGDATFIEQSDVTIDQCTIAHNGNPYEDSSQDSAISCVESRLRVTDSIIWNDLPLQIKSSDSTVFVTYSDIKDANESVEGLAHALGNIAVDPCFAAPGGWDATPAFRSTARWIPGDYHLKSAGWRWDPNLSGDTHWVRDDRTSRCIDAGNPADALGDEPVTIPGDPAHEWGINLRIDMGAYGGTREASMAPHGWALLTDLNNDGIVNLLDFNHLGEVFGTHRATTADANRDTYVDYADLSLLAEDWLKVTRWYQP